MYKNISNKLFALGLLAIFLLILSIPASFAQSDDVIPDSSNDVAVADTTMPSDVENVQAVSKDGVITISWDVATDDTEVTGYKIYYGDQSVMTDGGTYSNGFVDVGNRLSYDFKDLEDGKTYYFAVTAYDEAGNESENYSNEVSATFHSGTSSGDTQAPTVVKAEALDKYDVLVTFSEAVKLPEEHPESAFSIVEDSTKVGLDVLSASMNPEDDSQKTVLLTTSTQTKDTNYILTAGIEIKDLNGNPIESGTSDTAMFVGSGDEPANFHSADDNNSDTEAPQLVSVTPIDSTHIKVKFSEDVQFDVPTKNDFAITKADDINSLLKIVNTEAGLDDSEITLITDPQEAVAYNLVVVGGVKDKAGNEIDPVKNATVFTGIASSEVNDDTQNADNNNNNDQLSNQNDNADVTAPEDATNFMAKLVNTIVKLSWVASANSDGDLANYVLYKSKDGVKYDEGILIGPDKESFDLSDLTPGLKYFFKLTAKDSAGNESKGVVTSMTLPGTGPEMIFLLGASLGAGGLLRKRKKKIRK